MSKIYISPSTQEKNTYINGGTEEFWMNKIADVLVPLLKNSGFTVYRNRPEMNLKQIVDDSNSKKVDFHFAIHSNAGGGTGAEVFCHKFGGVGEKFARLLYNDISIITPTSDRGVKQGFNNYGEGKHMYELANTDASSALVEIDFHDNPVTAEWITSNIELIAKIFAKSICKHFGVKLWELDEKSDVELLVDELVKHGIFTNNQYWVNVLEGRQVVNLEYLKIAFSRSLNKMN